MNRFSIAVVNVTGVEGEQKHSKTERSEAFHLRSFAAYYMVRVVFCDCALVFSLIDRLRMKVRKQHREQHLYGTTLNGS